MLAWPARSTTSSSAGSTAIPPARGGWSSIRELVEELFAGEEAWIVGGAVRDELLGRPLVDLDIAVHEPETAARAFARRSSGAPFPLSETHGAWRVALEGGRTVDFTPLRGGFEHDIEDVRERRPEVFRVEPTTEALIREHAPRVVEPAGERLLGELLRLSEEGFRRLDDLGLLAPLGGSIDRYPEASHLESPEYGLAVFFGENVERFPISNELKRFARTLLSADRPADDSPRAIHRFRRATEPWALEALAFLGARELEGAVLEARSSEPKKPLVRGGELGIPPGPEVGRLLDEIAEERAAGTITTKEEALEYARRN